MAVHTLSYIATLNSIGFMGGLRSMEAGLKNMSNSLTGVTSKIKGVVVGLAKLGVVLAAVGIAAFTGLVYKATKAAIDWESSMANVAKTTGFNKQEIKELGDAYLDLSTKIPVSRTELAGIGEIAGRLGIKNKKDILEFTQTIAEMGVAFDMPVEEAADDIAKTANAMGLGIGRARDMGNVINVLGNNFATSESDIMRYTQQMGQFSQEFGLSFAEVAAAGTVLEAADYNLKKLQEALDLV